MINLSKYLICSAAASAVEGVPDIIKLLPLGRVSSQKGDFTVTADSFAAIQSAFKKRALDIVVDYEHQTLEDVQAPAAGWIKELILQDDAIAGRVEWTPKATEYLRNKEYRYLSPVVLVSKADQIAQALHSIGLTNTPAINGMFAIVNKFGGDDDEMEFLKMLAALLGLPEDASEEQVGAAIKKLVETAKTEDGAEVVANKTITGLLGVAETAKTEDVVTAIMALKSPTGMVPAADFMALKARLDNRDRDELVTKALKSGKISAAQKDWAEEYALKDPAGFTKFIEKAPQAVPIGELPLESATAKAAIDDEATLAVCKQLGVSKADLDKYGKDVG